MNIQIQIDQKYLNLEYTRHKQQVYNTSDQTQKESIKKVLRFTRYDQTKIWIQIWIAQFEKVQKWELMILLDSQDQYKHLGKRIDSFGYVDLKI